jgi:hypothetical protein
MTKAALMRPSRSAWTHEAALFRTGTALIRPLSLLPGRAQRYWAAYRETLACIDDDDEMLSRQSRRPGSRHLTFQLQQASHGDPEIPSSLGRKA